MTHGSESTLCKTKTLHMVGTGPDPDCSRASRESQRQQRVERSRTRESYLERDRAGLSGLWEKIISAFKRMWVYLEIFLF